MLRLCGVRFDDVAAEYIGTSPAVAAVAIDGGRSLSLVGEIGFCPLQIDGCQLGLAGRPDERLQGGDMARVGQIDQGAAHVGQAG